MVFLGFSLYRIKVKYVSIERDATGILGASVHFCPQAIQSKDNSSKALGAFIMHNHAAGCSHHPAGVQHPQPETSEAAEVNPVVATMKGKVESSPAKIKWNLPLPGCCSLILAARSLLARGDIWGYVARNPIFRPKAIPGSGSAEVVLLASGGRSCRGLLKKARNCRRRAQSRPLDGGQ
jgi:hypothetical protein